ncbi:hypothetical protein CH63R_09911 [Colletotrichum higginsianum IMI 349063]|uniref:Uncharacterized protein n=2 Tax=Colletotrichum higginsianum (strain IMI 349063) TaxID=759273 RepID=A0A1B7Y192_COLHI|nr:uncharacterized protein CH63R_09911 [Colletotrichum higginsianum IMI 349063]OBR05791.1 hypothetical protein CH63R_09911 [Colletotrichum higginsianum IMI 349063]
MLRCGWTVASKLMPLAFGPSMRVDRRRDAVVLGRKICNSPDASKQDTGVERFGTPGTGEHGRR